MSIVDYLLENEGADFAGEFAKLIRAEAERRLKTLPLRGRVVPEVDTISKNYREIRVKSYRLIYTILPERNTVSVLMIAHVKRDIEEMLLSHLLHQ